MAMSTAARPTSRRRTNATREGTPGIDMPGPRRGGRGPGPLLFCGDPGYPGRVEVPRAEVVVVLRLQCHCDLLVPDRDVRNISRGQPQCPGDRAGANFRVDRVLLCFEQRVHLAVRVVRCVERVGC